MSGVWLHRAAAAVVLVVLELLLVAVVVVVVAFYQIHQSFSTCCSGFSPLRDILMHRLIQTFKAFNPISSS